MDLVNGISTFYSDRVMDLTQQWELAYCIVIVYNYNINDYIRFDSESCVVQICSG